MRPASDHGVNLHRTAFALVVTFAASSLLASCGGGGGGASKPLGPSPLSITTASLPDGITLSSYVQVLNATGGERPYTWKISSGKIPTGLVLTTAGLLGGT